MVAKYGKIFGLILMAVLLSLTAISLQTFGTSVMYILQSVNSVFIKGSGDTCNKTIVTVLKEMRSQLTNARSEYLSRLRHTGVSVNYSQYFESHVI